MRFLSLSLQGLGALSVAVAAPSSPNNEPTSPNLQKRDSSAAPLVSATPRLRPQIRSRILNIY